MKKKCTYELSFLISPSFQDLLCVFLPSRQILSISSSRPLWYKNLHRKEDAKVQFIIIKNKSIATFPIDFLQEQAKNRWGAFLAPTLALNRVKPESVNTGIEDILLHFCPALQSQYFPHFLRLRRNFPADIWSGRRWATAANKFSRFPRNSDAT